ncbi:LysR family transcriptional regulator [Sphingomonas sp. QA11]|uniref:LysR family transcriptional regulator n=1 Tax=Sphingomonas sp. QA11 TaxID=2950605 RepID=UPI00234A35B6|nr:LysR family transcriptional regulator [Sphingomonas sp. QA11]WCM26573.1 LysR family transcriptional regulator [Sphingomonas sp. QA11]
MSIDWERQRAFLAVLREGSLSAAARALSVAQPTVRRRIEELEASLGTPLFTRSSGGLNATEAALALRDHAEAMAMAADAFVRAGSAGAREIAGTVRISASEVVAVEVLPPMLAALRRLHPALVIELSPSNRNEDMLRREADIAIRMVRPTQNALVARRIGAVPLGLHARADYLAAHGTPKTFEEVLALGIIGVEHDNAVLRALQTRYAISFADFIFRTDSDLAQVAAIRAGIGIGICQVPLAARDPALVRLLPDTFNIDLDTWVVMHEDMRGVARIKTTFDYLAGGLTDYLRAQPSVAASIAVAAPRRG